MEEYNNKLKVLVYQEESGTSPYEDWLQKLDFSLRARVRGRLLKLEKMVTLDFRGFWELVSMN